MADNEAGSTRARPSKPKLDTVYVVLTAGGRLLGDRRYGSAEEAAAALTAAAVPGVVLAALVAPADDQ